MENAPHGMHAGWLMTARIWRAQAAADQRGCPVGGQRGGGGGLQPARG
jgi:hypothetical protein